MLPAPGGQTIREVPSIHEPLLVNTIGHSAGAVIFGIFLFLFLKDFASARLVRGSWLSFSAAALAFLWDAGSLGAMVAETKSGWQAELLVAFSFAVLSMLPAVLLHLALDGRFPGLVAAGYLLSSSAALLHVYEPFHPESHARHAALVLIPVGFGILTAVAVVLLAVRKVPQARGYSSRIAGAMCLFLFAISFVHFGRASTGHGWSSELLVHHAGIPIALFVLLQDYRFVMLDAFVRFLANVLLAGLMTVVMIRAGLKLFVVETHGYRNPLNEALLLTALCFLMIGFALARNRVQRLLTNVVFRHTGLDDALHTIRAGAHAEQKEAAYLPWAASQLAAFMNTPRGEVMPVKGCPEPLRRLDLAFPIPVSDRPELRGRSGMSWAETLVPVRLSQGDTWYILLGRRGGGRRYLSEDLSFLARLSAGIVEQIERLRGAEVQRLVTQAELRALQAQINPHFLFNALNALYGMIPRENSGARRTVVNLADIFRYFLQTQKTFIPLNEELQIVKAYLEIERLRLGRRLQTNIDVDARALDVLIPTLSIQPLVENAIKHGISANPEPGLLELVVQCAGKEIKVMVRDSGAGSGQPADSGPGTGVGLANVSRRLQLCYSTSASLTMESSSAGTTVTFLVPVTPQARQKDDPRRSASPLQDLPDAVSLAFTDDQLQ